MRFLRQKYFFLANMRKHPHTSNCTWKNPHTLSGDFIHQAISCQLTDLKKLCNISTVMTIQEMFTTVMTIQEMFSLQTKTVIN